MVTVDEQKLVLPASPELFVEALHTLPVDVQSGHFQFYANGLNPPPFTGEEDLSYINSCAEHGIIPFSDLRLVYDSNRRTFGTKYDPLKPLDVPHRVSRQLVQAALNMALIGGRTHHITVEPLCPEGFKIMRDSLHPQMLATGYHIGSARYVLSHWHADGQTPQRFEASTLQTYHGAGLELLVFGPSRVGIVEEGLSGPAKKQLRDWFSGLKAKYAPSEE